MMDRSCFNLLKDVESMRLSVAQILAGAQPCPDWPIDRMIETLKPIKIACDHITALKDFLARLNRDLRRML